MPQSGILAFENDSNQESLEICIHSVGMNTVEEVKTLLAAYPLTGMQTANVFLNCNDRFAPWVYGELCRLGFFFTGIKPLCSEREYMVMHNPGQVGIYLEDYELSGEFAALGCYIKDVYLRSRCTV